MNLKNEFCTLIDGEYVINDIIDKSKFPLLDFISFPDDDVFDDAIQYDKDLNDMFHQKIKILNKMYPGNDRKSKQLKKNKLSLARNNIQKIFRFKFMMERDDVIYKLNKHFNKLNIYKHDKIISKKILIDVYQNNKGNRRFPTQAGYDFFYKTGQQPYYV